MYRLSKMKRVGNKQLVFWGFFALLCAAFILPQRTSAATFESGEKKNVIKLLEKKIPIAYHFSWNTNPVLPDFVALNRVYPKWDGGDPEKARNNWLALQYVGYDVDYRIEKVTFLSANTAMASGTKTVVSRTLCKWAETYLQEEKMYHRYLFSHEAKRKRFCTQRHKSRHYAEVMVYRNPTFGWQMVSEKLYKKKPDPAKKPKEEKTKQGDHLL